jgi:hypothetical protein
MSVMKNILYITVSLFFFTQITFAQYSSIGREDINTNEVPELVTNAQRNKFNDGFVTKWNVHKESDKVENDALYYMATFKKKGRLGNYAYYTEQGDLLAYSLFVDSFEVPANIREYCFRKYDNAKIKAAELIDLENPQRFIYRVRLNADGQLTYLYFDTNGNPIDKFKLPREIFLFI